MQCELLAVLMMIRTRLVVIAGITLGVAAILLLGLPPIPQSQAYHNFADKRTLFGIPNFLDVISNLAFLCVGLQGIFYLRRHRASGVSEVFIEKIEQWPYVVFFWGIVLTSFGSAYYHLAPDNVRLVWDRLPMTLIFMSMLAAIIAERINVRAGLLSFLPLLAFGISSVIYWYLSELRGEGDLRFYIIVQFYSMLAILLIVKLFPAKYTRSTDLLGVFAFYALAKVFELLDLEIFVFSRIVSGHTLKHFAAAFAVYWLLRMLRYRKVLVVDSFIG